MTVYTMCVDPVAGRYLAFFSEDPDRRIVAGSIDEAVGKLVMSCKGIVTIDSVFEVDTNG